MPKWTSLHSRVSTILEASTEIAVEYEKNKQKLKENTGLFKTFRYRQRGGPYRCTTAVLSIGLAPGLTNLISLHAKNLMDQVDNIDISIMLGMGDQHGKAAIEWTVDNLGMNFDVVKEGRKVAVASFTEAIKTDFGARLGRRKAYRFNFSERCDSERIYML